MSNFHHNASSSGFTLVEISMVLLLFASAVGGLLSFFPVGLRMEANAISDSAQTMFALDILAQVEKNAANITDWGDWEDTATFARKAFENIEVGGNEIRTSFKGKKLKYEKVYRTEDKGTLIEHYLTTKGNMRYVLQVSPVETPIYFSNNRIRRVVIWVTDRRDGDPFMNSPFTIDLIFQPSLKDIMKGGA